MTEEEARKTLSGKLVCGDLQQIEAVKFLRQVEECCEAFVNGDDMYYFECDVVNAAELRLQMEQRRG